MSLNHHGYLLELNNFHNNVSQILKSLESGDAGPLFKNALKITQQKSAETWIFSDIGDTLFDISKFDDSGRPYMSPIETKLSNGYSLPPSLIGYWLFIIFSEHLHTCKGIGNDFEILAFCLEKSGWKNKDIHYWFWMRPSQSKGGGGWLDKQSIHYLYGKLEMSKPLIRALKPSIFGQKMGNLMISIPEGQVDYLNRCHRAFNFAFEMLDKAMREDKEIFTLIAYN
jgi:hypothetical protein